MNSKDSPSSPGRWAAAVATALLLLNAGCMVGPDYHAPQTAVAMAHWTAPAAATALANAPAATKVAATAPVEAWWTTFSDPQLGRLVERALADSPDIEIATQRVREARAGLRIAGGAREPRLGMGASRTEYRRTGPLATLHRDNYPLYQAGFDASWELDLFGGAQRAVEAAGARADAADEARRGVQLTLAAEVARTYIDFRAAQRRVSIARTNLALQERTLALTQEKLHAGVVSELDVFRAAALVDNTRAAIPLLANQADASLHGLGVLVGAEPDALAQELAATAPIPAVPAVVAVGLPADLLRRRPDVRAAERRLAAATALIGVAQAELYPHLGLAGSLGFVGTASAGLFEASNRYFSIGPGLHWNLFAGGQIRARIEAEKARTAAAYAEYRKTVLAALADADNALGAFAAEQSRRSDLVAAVDTSRRAVATATELYRQGVTDYLSVVDAQRSLAAAEDNLAQGDRANATNLVALYKSLGGDWSAPAAAIAATPVSSHPPITHS